MKGENKIPRSKIRVAVLASGPSSVVVGGAERFYNGLVAGFESIGCATELISIAADEPNFEAILANYARTSELDLSDFDVVVSTKAPTFAVQHPRHVVYLVHTVRAFDDMFDDVFPEPSEASIRQRAKLHAMDFESLHAAKARFAIGHEVANRLYRWRGLRAEVIHPPLGIGGFRNDGQGDYFFLPGRLHRWKRVDLVVEAVLRSPLPLKLVIAGTGETEQELRDQAAGDPRIVFLGRIDDAELIDWYAKALAVPFVPIREDYGYITLEAFSSQKPVITCTDSGEPTQLVRHGQNGLVCEPSASSLQAALEWIHRHRDEAKRMGDEGADLVSRMSWPDVAARLLQAGLADDQQPVAPRKLQVTVLDMQPIDPPVGGGRLRLLGLYHALGPDIQCTYVGSYDWPGESFRQHQLSPSLEEINVPLSPAHHKAADELSSKLGGKTVIDIAFGRQGHLSPKYIDEARTHISQADVVVFSHPWVYPLVHDDLSCNQTVIYDSQNVEGFLRAQLLDETSPNEKGLLRDLVDDELRVCQRADLILACSQEDLERFNRVYRVPADKMRVVPNGVMAFAHPNPRDEDRKLAKQQLGVDQWSLIAFFIGSAYGPNVEAAQFIVQALAPAAPDVLFVVGGGVGSNLASNHENVCITGQLTEDQRKLWLIAADLAVNPMFSGSGTNIKMFDFMAMGLPTITTAIGARGIETAGQQAIRVVESDVPHFMTALGELRSPELRRKIGDAARACVESGYAWERISQALGALLAARYQYGTQSLPLFSVVIPTYERHHQLNELIARLRQQLERDFEVVIVDQSHERWSEADQSHGFALTYFHSPVKGAVRARNSGATLAQGDIIAFIDDDCLPDHSWLLNARKYFSDPAVVGVEGKITSDHLGAPNWRPVTNVGFEGMGFMTANLFVRRECFNLLGGFDLAFDHPHFREDTDLGWRLQDLGAIPYAHDVVVHHPAQPRSLSRESAEVRNAFFIKDALLYKKHPEKYQKLFFAEGHYLKTDGFGLHLIAGFQSLGIDLPNFIVENMMLDVANP